MLMSESCAAYQSWGEAFHIRYPSKSPPFYHVSLFTPRLAIFNSDEGAMVGEKDRRGRRAEGGGNGGGGKEGQEGRGKEGGAGWRERRRRQKT